jgi:hypothetical protein
VSFFVARLATCIVASGFFFPNHSAVTYRYLAVTQSLNVGEFEAFGLGKERLKFVPRASAQTR